MTIMTTLAPAMTNANWWWLATAIALALGIGVALAVDLAIGTLVVLVALPMLARAPHPAERMVGLYWFALAVYSIVFHGLVIRFGFYPFYLAFLVGIVITLVRGGFRVDRTVAWLYLGFMLIVAVSFISFGNAVDSGVVQRLLAYVIGALVFLQFRSTAGLRPVTGAAILTSVAIASFVIYNAVETDFAYRASLSSNPNTTAQVVAFGAVVAIALLVDRLGVPGYQRQRLLLALLLAIMLYAAMLLASRGMVIALLVAMTAILVRAIVTDWRKSRVFIVIGVVAAVALFLPGGQSLIERFTAPDQHVESAGSRIPIWEVTIDSLTTSSVPQLVFGHGFDSSKPIVERHFTGLTSVHNTYLQIMFEFGLLGFLLHAALLGYLAWRGWSTPGRYGLIILGLTWLLIVVNLSGDVADTFHYWIVLGYVAAIVRWTRPDL